MRLLRGLACTSSFLRYSLNTIEPVALPPSWRSSWLAFQRVCTQALMTLHLIAVQNGKYVRPRPLVGPGSPGTSIPGTLE